MEQRDPLQTGTDAGAPGAPESTDTPPAVEASRSVAYLGELLDDDRLAAEFGAASAQTLASIPLAETALVEAYVDARLKGQAHQLAVRVHRPSLEHVREEFSKAYAARHGQAPPHEQVEVVTVRVKRIGKPNPARPPAVG